MTRPAWVVQRSDASPDAVARLLATVPEWFGREESNAEYIEDARTTETWLVRNVDDAVVGLTLVRHHFQYATEIHLTVVDRAHHGQGVGTAMIDAIAADLTARGVRFLEVKTLGPSDPNPEYARTRRFYESVGFVPLEETDLWGTDTPCLIVVKALGR